MKILIATDSFKGSMTSLEVSNYLEKSFKAIDQSLEIIKVPISDGGEGMVDAFVTGSGGEKVDIKVSGPLGKSVNAFYGVSKDGERAYIEVAAAIGLYLLDKTERNPLGTTTYGVGELILDAIERGCKDIIIGLGGSSTNDGGMGMARALGVKFLDKSREELLGRGLDLEHVASIDTSKMDPRLKTIKFRVACDVDNLLTGERGATHVFAPQKGADRDMVGQLEYGMLNYQDMVNKWLKKDVSQIKGGGAAGGLGAAFVTYLNADMEQGIKLVIDETNLEDKIKKADLIITGEGKIDDQTLHGKVPVGIAHLAKKHGKKTIAIAGKVAIEKDQLQTYGIEGIICITPEGQQTEEAMKRAKDNIINSAKVIYDKYIRKEDQ